MESKAVVSLTNGKKAFGDNEVLKDISLTVNAGDVLAIIGLAFAVLSALGTFFGGSADGGDIASALFGLVLPLVCVLLAYNIKKENNL